MPDIPIGYLVSVLIAATITYLALWPRPMNGPRVTPSLVLAMSGSEIPFLFLALNLLATGLAISEGRISSAPAWAALLLSACVMVGQIVIIVLAVRTLTTFSTALRSTFGDTILPTRPSWMDWLRAVLVPLHLPRRGIERVRDLTYGPHGRSNLLDVYRCRSQVPARGVLIQLHGGGFFSGRKSKEARLLLERLAAKGWLCLSADYRLHPAVFPDQVIDAKRVIAWARAHASDYGADPGRVVLVGGSAGAHTAVICALTAGDRRFQPGFEDADTRLSAVIGLYGFYGPAPTEDLLSAPRDYLDGSSDFDYLPGEPPEPRTDVPPIMIVHGDRDPMVAPAAARELVELLRPVSAAPVAYVELPGAHHTLDRFDSLRCCGVTDGIEEFLHRSVDDAPAGGGAPQMQSMDR